MTGPRLFNRNKPTQFYWKTANVIDDLGLSVYAFRLYAHLARMASRKDADVSTRALATACKMSAHAVSDAKKELADAGLISLRPIPGGRGRPSHEITLLDIQERNIEHCQSSQQELISSPQESISSRGDTPREEQRRTGEGEPIEPDESATTTPRQKFSRPIQVPDGMRAQPKPHRNGKPAEKESADVLALQLHPANKAYFQVYRVWPTEASMRILSQRITDQALWGQVLEKYALEQRDPNQIKWLLDRYNNNNLAPWERDGHAGNGSGARSRNGASRTAYVPPPAPEDIPPDGYEFFYTASGERKTRKSGPDLLPARLTLTEEQLRASYVLAGKVAGEN